MHEEELQAEYDRGFHDAELELANNAKDNEDTLQSQTDSPEKYVITRGQKGEIVKDIQTRIISKGWNIKADGIYGAMTEQAVREFQQLNTLRITGDVDILTFWLLVDENSKGTEALSHNATPSPSPTPEVHNNDSTNPDSSTEQNVSELLTVTEPNEEENEGSDKTKISLSTGT